MQVGVDLRLQESIPMNGGYYSNVNSGNHWQDAAYDNRSYCSNSSVGDLNFVSPSPFQEHYYEHWGAAAGQYIQPSIWNNYLPNSVEAAMKTSAGRPAHAVMAFGFGGTFIVIKPQEQPTYQMQSHNSGPIMVHSLSCLSNDSTQAQLDSKSKAEILKWIDQQISKCSYEQMDAQDMSMLWSALKIAYEFHGKLRSVGAPVTESNGPESAVAQLLVNGTISQMSDCLQSIPSEQLLQETAMKMKWLLLSGKHEEALQCAEQGQLWGPALVLAARLGDKFYSATVSKMAVEQLAAGPLRTLSLLLAGQPGGEAFEENILEQWHENLAVMLTNRTQGDENIITLLGDSIWRTHGKVAAAHLCYLMVDTDPESFFKDGRICLLGADHWRYPRTYATATAIERTELYEYAKKMGNSQFVLTPFQPYKLVYAAMLAESGKTTDALRCCQAVIKALKSAQRNNPCVDACKKFAVELESRLVMNMDDGKGTCRKLAGRLVHTFNYVIGSLPTPKITRFNSSTSLTTPNNTSTFPPRSHSEPDFSKSNNCSNMSMNPRDVKASYLQRIIGSNVLQRASSLVKPSKQANLGDSNKFYFDEKIQTWVEKEEEKEGRDDGMCILYESNSRPPVIPDKNTEYYSRYMKKLSRIHPNNIFKTSFSPTTTTTPMQRVEV